MEGVALNLKADTPRKMEKRFRDEISEAGFAWPNLKRLLPDWSDVAFESLSGVVELRAFLTKNTGLQLNKDGVLTLGALPPARFKTNSATLEDQVVAARSLATACARLIAKSTQLPYKKFPDSASELRGEILKRTNGAWVDLPLLVNTCWAHGIPVLYVPALPAKGKKMEGMVTYVADRPVIILTKKVPHPDWLLFILAHEMGHIAKGHLIEEDGQAVVDDTVDISDSENRDEQELEANKFASELLAPSAKEVHLKGRLPNARQLAERASAFGLQNGMAPGYVILNAVHNSRVNGKKPYALGQKALGLLGSYNNGTAEGFCRDAIRSNIDHNALRSDSIEFLENLKIF